MDKPQALQQTSKIPGKEKDRKTERQKERKRGGKTERQFERKEETKMQLNAAGTCGQMLAIGHVKNCAKP